MTRRVWRAGCAGSAGSPRSCSIIVVVVSGRAAGHYNQDLARSWRWGRAFRAAGRGGGPGHETATRGQRGRLRYTRAWLRRPSRAARVVPVLGAPVGQHVAVEPGAGGLDGGHPLETGRGGGDDRAAAVGRVRGAGDQAVALKRGHLSGDCRAVQVEPGGERGDVLRAGVGQVTQDDVRRAVEHPVLGGAGGPPGGLAEAHQQGHLGLDLAEGALVVVAHSCMIQNKYLYHTAI